MRRQWMILGMAAAILAGCGGESRSASRHADMSAKEAQQAGYVTSGPGGSANTDKLEAFYRSFQARQSSQLTVAHYTDEGDPVYLDLRYDGQLLHYVFDNTWDDFGGQGKGVKETTCRMFAKQTGSYGMTYGTEYYVSDCADDIGYSRQKHGEYHIYFQEEASID